VDRTRARLLMDEAEEFLKAKYAKDKKVAVRLVNGKLTATGLIIKVEFMEKTPTGQVVTPEAAAYDRMEKPLGLPPRLSQFKHPLSHKLYTVEGYKMKGRKYPILCRQETDGRLYKFTADQVVRFVKEYNEE
jgi:hypothetical protein